MPRLDRGIHSAALIMVSREGVIAVYITASRPYGTIYTGVTSDLARRIYEHREGVLDGFTKRYGVKRLVWYEVHDSIVEAIRREKAIKHYSRAWKLDLIAAMNPEWLDLYESLNG